MAFINLLLTSTLKSHGRTENPCVGGAAVNITAKNGKHPLGDAAAKFQPKSGLLPGAMVMKSLSRILMGLISLPTAHTPSLKIVSPAPLLVQLVRILVSEARDFHRRTEAILRDEESHERLLVLRWYIGQVRANKPGSLTTIQIYVVSAGGHESVRTFRIGVPMEVVFVLHATRQYRCYANGPMASPQWPPPDRPGTRSSLRCHSGIWR